MKTVTLTTIAALFCTSAMAMSAYDSKSMNCGDIQQKMKGEKMMILRYPSSSHPDVMLYTRAVSNPMSCLGQGVQAGISVPTADNKACKMKTCAFATGKGPNKNH